MSPINEDDVQAGLQTARREVDDGLYRSRWERARTGRAGIHGARMHDFVRQLGKVDVTMRGRDPELYM